MDQFLDQLDMLDTVLAVFGALIVAMWFGRGKSLQGILVGAFVGGFIKPVIFTVLGLGAMGALMATEDSGTPQQTQAQQDATRKFWTK
jgi:dolichol kinase